MLASCATPPGYLAKQGGYLLRDSFGARGIDALIADPATPAGTRAFLARAREIKRFTVGTLGLRDNGNYSRYKAIDRDFLATVVSACDAASFTPYYWSYPLLGKLPYMGFYERPDAETEAARLGKEGWDVVVRKVDAFSTLGFLRDPLYSFMERYSPFQLALLIIHEQTHATLFVKGQAQFNEELATFVGEEGALAWLRAAYGEGSAEYRAALDEQADSETFLAFVGELTKALDEVYRGTLSRGEKLARKKEIIEVHKARFAAETQQRFRTAGFRDIGELPITNAWLSLYGLYTEDVPLLRDFWERRCGGDLRRFIAEAVRLSRKGDVRELMRQELSSF